MTWQDAELLRCYLGSTDKVGSETTYDWLVSTAQRAGLPGATVTHGSIGYGQDGQIHRNRAFQWAPDLPVVVECVASTTQLETFLAEVALTLPDLLITRQAVRRLMRRGEHR